MSSLNLLRGTRFSGGSCRLIVGWKKRLHRDAGEVASTNIVFFTVGAKELVEAAKTYQGGV